MDDEIPERRDSHASSSHEVSLEPTSKRREDLGKHSVYTHFPKDRNCEICKRTKITKAPCRRCNGGAVPRAENFGDLITADHRVLSENCESRTPICSRGAGLGHSDGRINSLGGDQDLRTSTLVRHRPIQGESNIDFLGESEGSLPQPHDSFPDAGEAINDFWSMSRNFIYRHHVQSRVKLYSPREESFPIPLKYIDVSRPTHTNLDVKQEKRIDDYWNIDALAGLLWERQFEKILLGHGWEKVSNWECLFVHRKKGLFLSVYVDDIRLAGKKQNIDPMWKVLNKEVDLGEPTSFLDRVYLGCTQRQCERSKEIVDNYSAMFESRISAG